MLDDPSEDDLENMEDNGQEDTPKRSLRPRRNQPEPNYLPPPDLSRRTSGRRESMKLLTSDMIGDSPKKATKQKSSATARMQVRSGIATHTKAKRDAFLYRHSDYFLPLLPVTNYVAKLGNHSHGPYVPYVELSQQPEGVDATMKPYQLSGLSFLAHMNENGMPCMLGDEMGLGKTLQTLSLFQLLEEREERQNTRSAENRPYLVVCPLSVVNSWVTEARRWTPKLKVLRFHGPKSERDSLKKVATGQHDRYGNETMRSKKRTGDRRRASNKIVISLDSDDEDGVYKIVVTSYETFVAEQSWFRTAFVWRYIVLDEGHRVKNNLTAVSQALQNIRAEYRLILTGTPLQNDLHEMWALLHWLLPDVFIQKTADLFKNSFNLSKGQANTTVMDSARQLLELLMLRRMKNSPGVNLDLPPKEEVLLYVPLTPLQRFWYMRLLTRSGDALLDDLFSGAKAKEKDALRKDIAEQQKIKDLEQVEARIADEQSANADVWSETREIMKQNLENERQEQKKSDWTKLMNLVMQLRKCCSHPYLLPGVQPEPYFLGDHITRASGKFIVLEKLLQHLILKCGKKVIIFSGFKTTLNLCEDLLSMLGNDGESFRYLRFDGGTDRARRNLDIRLFNDKSTDYKAMLVSTRAGGLGINLTAATEAIFLDEDWNPQITLQAEARAHRIGQTKPVTIYKLCTQGTVEEQMMGRIRKKLYLSAKITESMKSVHGTPTTAKKKGRPSDDDDKPQLDVSQLKTLHVCADCSKKTTDAGGMLFRCRFCSLAFCEDCLNFDRASLIGDSLPELQLLDFGEVSQAFFVKCHVCADTHDEEPDMKHFCEEQAREFDRAWQKFKAEKEAQDQLEEEETAAASAPTSARTTKAHDDQSIFPNIPHGLPLNAADSLTRPRTTRASPRGKKTRDALSTGSSSRASSQFSLDLTDATTVTTPMDAPVASGYFGTKKHSASGSSTPRDASTTGGHFSGANKNTTGQLRFGAVAAPKTAPLAQSAPPKAVARKSATSPSSLSGSSRKRRAENGPEEDDDEEEEVANGVAGLRRERTSKKQQRLSWFPEWV
ncbi:putative iswi chromatin-remodeling complex atpase isw2 protein [Neofusicoccum parvum UCRNP2]|uniref:Putative iswi chromatin-remodeling complex atpase isw2 protein n=1 Tax=Botryosphaeria parva (strain UCR-NP2) TaxID=1287680 RepID=R1EEL6_BOTPV|nr:putative iswi chromatin-remodeling complex atpase isw2 protein [Neofusicoccum parvum UCRNP2]